MKTLSLILVLVLLSACSSQALVHYGFRDLDVHYGKSCVKMGYEAQTDDWRECIMDHRRSRPGVTNEQLSRQISQNNFQQRHRDMVAKQRAWMNNLNRAGSHHQRGMCAAHGTC